MKLPARTPAGRIQKIEKEAGQVNAGITEEIKHSNGGGDKIKIPNDNTGDAEKSCEASSNVRFAAICNLEVIKHRENVIIGDGCKETWGTGEALQGSTEGGENDPDVYDG